MAITESTLNWDYDGPIIEVAGLQKHFPQNSGLIHQLIGGERRTTSRLSTAWIWP